jgi:hypothetical protein
MLFTYIVVMFGVSVNEIIGFTAMNVDAEPVLFWLSLTFTCTTSGEARSELLPKNTVLQEVLPN